MFGEGGRIGAAGGTLLASGSRGGGGTALGSRCRSAARACRNHGQGAACGWGTRSERGWRQAANVHSTHPSDPAGRLDRPVHRLDEERLQRATLIDAYYFYLRLLAQHEFVILQRSAGVAESRFSQEEACLVEGA